MNVEIHHQLRLWCEILFYRFSTFSSIIDEALWKISASGGCNIGCQAHHVFEIIIEILSLHQIRHGVHICSTGLFTFLSPHNLIWKELTWITDLVLWWKVERGIREENEFILFHSLLKVIKWKKFKEGDLIKYERSSRQ